MAEEPPNLVKDTTLQTQKAQWTQSRRSLFFCFFFKEHVLKNEEKGKNLEAANKTK